MHIDMHYAGTYAMAKLAGLSDDAARRIGNSAQFVDDAVEDVAVIDEETGNFYASEISARHCGTLEYIKESHVYMKSYIDQLNIWVPFHFLPGNQGESLTQKLVCQTDSTIAQDMIENHINYACQLKNDGKPWGDYLVGLAAHVYADTFAHYGFSGVSSRRNLVNGSTIMEREHGDMDNAKDNDISWQEKVFKFWEERGGFFPNIKQAITSHFGEQTTRIGEGTMGHPGVGKLPDLPYLVYSFQYEHEDLLHGGQPIEPRNNPKTYLDACKKMHKYLLTYAQESNQVDESSRREFHDVESEVIEILSYREENAKTRIKHWQEKAKEFWKIEIPIYDGDSWQQKFLNAGNSDSILSTDAYRFYRASAHHKMVVLDKILPKYGIQIECRQFRAGSFSNGA